MSKSKYYTRNHFNIMKAFWEKEDWRRRKKHISCFMVLCG